MFIKAHIFLLKSQATMSNIICDDDVITSIVNKVVERSNAISVKVRLYYRREGILLDHDCDVLGVTVGDVLAVMQNISNIQIMQNPHQVILVIKGYMKTIDGIIDDLGPPVRNYDLEDNEVYIPLMFDFKGLVEALEIFRDLNYIQIRISNLI